MVRRVGFGDDDPRPERSVADRVLDGFRKRAAQDKARREAAQANAKPAGKARWSLIVPLIWLITWPGSLVLVAVALNLSGGSLDRWSVPMYLIAISIWFCGRVVLKIFRT